MSEVPSAIGTQHPPSVVSDRREDPDPERASGESTPRWLASIDHAVVAYGVTAFVAMWVTRSFWWPGRYVVTFDGYTYAGPNLVITEDATRAGRLALWNDAIFGGVAHLGNPQAGVLYPPRLASLWLENNRALGVLTALHVVLLGLGMVALTRRLGLRPWTAGFVGVISVLNGAVLTKSMQVEQIMVLGWAPWLLAAIVTTLHTQRSAGAIAATSAVTAAILLAGHPQMVFETIVLATAMTIGIAASGGRWRRLPRLAAGVGLGALIAAPQLMATAVATSQSVVRHGRDETLLVDPRYSLLPGAGARALLGTVMDRDAPAFVGSFESVAFVGVVIVVLAVVGFVDSVGRTDRRPWAIALGACAGLALIWSLGSRTPLFRLAAAVVPGFDLARVSARWLVVVVFVACLFAGAGIEAIATHVRRAHVIAAASTLSVGLVVIAGRRLHGGDRGVVIEWLVLAAVALAAIVVARRASERSRQIAVGILALVAMGTLGAMSVHSPPQRASTGTPFTSSAYRTATTDWLAGQDGYVVAFTDDGRGPEYSVPGLRPNANALVGISSIDGYDGGVQVTDRWAAALRRLTPDPAVDLPLRNSVTVPLDTVQLGRLGVRFVLIDRTRPIAELVPGWLGPQASDERFEVWENPAWVGEAIAWSSAQQVGPRGAPDLLRARADELTATALVTDLGEPLVCDPAEAACAPVPLELDRRTPEHAIIATSSDHRTLVTVNQQYDDGWRATVDGERVDVLEIDGLFMGVDVPAGAHEVAWSYRPRWLTPTLVVGCVGVVVAVATALCAGLRRATRSARR